MNLCQFFFQMSSKSWLKFHYSKTVFSAKSRRNCGSLHYFRYFAFLILCCGHLTNISRARQAAVFKIVHQETKSKPGNVCSESLFATNEAMLAADLICEFLDYHKLSSTLTVFIAEANLDESYGGGAAFPGRGPLATRLSLRSAGASALLSELVAVHTNRGRAPDGAPAAPASSPRTATGDDSRITTHPEVQQKPRAIADAEAATRPVGAASLRDGEPSVPPAVALHAEDPSPAVAQPKPAPAPASSAQPSSSLASLSGIPPLSGARGTLASLSGLPALSGLSKPAGPPEPTPASANGVGAGKSGASGAALLH